MSELYKLHIGDGPLLISIPHLGTEIPSSLKHGYSEVALSVADTDWHLDRLYNFAKALGATLLGARVSRYVIDLNRPPNDESLYPGQTTTGLCPTETFRGEAVYRPGQEPDQAEKQRRVAAYWQPYHTALQAELARLRERHPNVLLWEAHSIASVLPRLFDAKLPDLNLGTQDGRTANVLVQNAAERAAADSAYTWVANGRFKGGYITRHYGEPERGIHAVQLEMCQCIYMNEDAPFSYHDARAAALQPTLQRMVGGALNALEHL
ncbi:MULTISPECIES: N-formylglutamate deformylase [Paraburkholderia]|uniref:N-formylglutamate deformylase n=1 Tax=Paraburkholderia podalyriae TaxID=1938811 RepID=A0ABR7PYD5_9BURK|nr:N-formylglutamate deformylase [Paraburkholderia podalyriae]MBC8751273.1 N-formylglutamate deformylase [Paraburkholderia podalyriae]